MSRMSGYENSTLFCLEAVLKKMVANQLNKLIAVMFGFSSLGGSVYTDYQMASR